MEQVPGRHIRKPEHGKPSSDIHNSKKREWGCTYIPARRHCPQCHKHCPDFTPFDYHCKLTGKALMSAMAVKRKLSADWINTFIEPQLLKSSTKPFLLNQAEGELFKVTEELDEATRKKEIAIELYHELAAKSDNANLFDKVVDLSYENEQLQTKIQILHDKPEKAYEFMKQFVINRRNTLDVFKERFGEVKEWVQKKVAGMSGRGMPQAVDAWGVLLVVVIFCR